jgi:hypothetical protein
MSFNSEPIPQGVRDIADKAFQRCPELSYMDLFSFDALVFDHCSSL